MGVVYERGGVRLLHGEAESIVLGLRPGFDLALYDPPRSHRYMDPSNGFLSILSSIANRIVAFLSRDVAESWGGQTIPTPTLCPAWARDEVLVLTGAPVSMTEPPFSDEPPPPWCPPARPSALYRWLYAMIRPSSVMDPFAGSGRSLIEAARLGIHAVGIEKMEDRALEIAKAMA